MPTYLTDPDGPISIAPLVRAGLVTGQPIYGGNPVMFNDFATSSRGRSRTTLETSTVKETPVPTVLHDMDAPPYFDDPVEEG